MMSQDNEGLASQHPNSRTRPLSHDQDKDQSEDTAPTMLLWISHNQNSLICSKNYFYAVFL